MIQAIKKNHLLISSNQKILKILIFAIPNTPYVNFRCRRAIFEQIITILTFLFHFFTIYL
jgi:hypothetical protein